MATGLPRPVRHLAAHVGRPPAGQPHAQAGRRLLGRAAGRAAAPPHPARGRAVAHALVPAGDRMVSAGRGCLIKVWDMAGKGLFTLLGHDGRVTSLARVPGRPHPGQRRQHGRGELWDLRTGQELVGLRRHAGPVTAAAFARPTANCWSRGASPPTAAGSWPFGRPEGRDGLGGDTRGTRVLRRSGPLSVPTRHDRFTRGTSCSPAGFAAAPSAGACRPSPPRRRPRSCRRAG